MAVPSSLFIQPIFQRTGPISSPLTEVLSVQANLVMIDNILVVNLMDVVIFVSLYISQDNFMIIPPTEIPPNSTVKVLKEAYFSVPTGQTVLAMSNAYQNLFNISVEGRSFKEVV